VKTGRKRLMTFLYDVAIVGALAFVGLCIFVWATQNALVFPAGGKVVRTPATLGWAYEDVRLPVQGGTTCGWYMPVDGARATILFSHGNAGTIDERLELCPILRDLGCNVLLYDYGGYGNSTGKRSETRCYADIRAMRSWLTDEKGIAPDRIILYGRSLGSGPTLQLATEVRPAAVILESAFTSVPAMARELLAGVPVQLLLQSRFDNLAKIGKVDVPKLILHSPDDDIIPYAQGKALFEKATEPKRFVEIQGDHNGGHFESEGSIRRAIADLLDEAVGAS